MYLRILKFSLTVSFLSIALVLTACGSEGQDDPLPFAGCERSDDCGEDAPYCSAQGFCEMREAGFHIGDDENPVEPVLIYQAERTLELTDLEFNPEKDTPELWILRRELASSDTCIQSDRSGCAALEGTVAIVWNPGSNSPTFQTLKDGNAWHFMRRPPALAFGVNDTFATVGEARTGNFLDDPNDFIGPTLWSSDLSIFAKDPGLDEFGNPLNGSHLDMLHHAPFGMGIAHEVDNAYWVFNGQLGSLDRADFNLDHGPGYHYHGDGHMLRYAIGELARVEDIPGHMIVDKEERILYVADTGNARVVALDIDSGTEAGPAAPNYENLPVFEEMKDYDLQEFIAPGTLTTPSGLAMGAGVLYVSDNATSTIHAFDLETGDLVRSLELEFDAGSLAGMTIGPDEMLYFVDMTGGAAYRLEAVK